MVKSIADVARVGDASVALAAVDDASVAVASVDDASVAVAPVDDVSVVAEVLSGVANPESRGQEQVHKMPPRSLLLSLFD